MNTPASTLTSGQRAQLAAELQTRQTALQQQLAAHLHGQTRAERAHEVAQQDNDDAPQRRPEREIAMALTDHERAELNAVTDALARVKRDDFGICPDCDAQIPFDRMKAEPWALRCVSCETKHETRRT